MTQKCMSPSHKILAAAISDSV